MAEPQVNFALPCRACHKTHQFLVNRGYLKSAVNAEGSVKLYCINANRIFSLTEKEKTDTRNAFAEGVL